MHSTVDLLRALRGQGLSQTEIAKQTGIPQSRLSRWESGAVPVAADDALKLARIAATRGISWGATEGAPPVPNAINTEVRDAA